MMQIILVEARLGIQFRPSDDTDFGLYLSVGPQRYRLDAAQCDETTGGRLPDRETGEQRKPTNAKTDVLTMPNREPAMDLAYAA
jgi:hypothetical protein